jgi:uncharacterized membrane protein HdeD (DUF308 family)
VSSWIVPLLRALPAVALAIVITFSADHSAPLGLLTFGIFGVVAGAVLAAAAWRSPTGLVRTLGIVQGALTLVAGIAALAVVGGGLPYLVFAVSGWAVVTGFIELYVGIRTRGASPAARDQIFAGALTVVLAAAVLLVPPGFVQPFTGPDGVERELTASIIVVGLLGAYWAILGVFLAIGAFSLKWSDATPSESLTEIPTEPKASS